MPDLQKGYFFSGVSPNNSVTAEKLNTLVDGATILTGFYTGKGETTTAADGDYFLFYETASGLFRKIQKSSFVTAGKARTGFRNLVAHNNAATPNTQIDVTADEVVMRAANGNVRYATAFAATLDITSYASAATPNGRDYTPLGSSAFRGIWAISDGTNDRLLFSTAVTPGSSPTLPAGYSYQALLGVVRLDGSGILVRFVQRGCEVAITPPGDAAATAPALNPFIGAAELTNAQVNATSRSFSAVDLSRCIPSIASQVRGMIGLTADSSVVTNGVTYAIASKGAGALNSSPSDVLGLQLITVFPQNAATGTSYGYFGAAPFETPIQTAQQISLAVTGAGFVHSMRINGYTLNL